MFETTRTSLGELILALYDEYLAIYDDADMAAVAAAATLNELLAEEVTGQAEAVEAA